jgi:hypothetical protein
MDKRRTSNTVVMLQQRVVEIKCNFAIVIFGAVQSKAGVAVVIVF